MRASSQHSKSSQLDAIKLKEITSPERNTTSRGSSYSLFIKNSVNFNDKVSSSGIVQPSKEMEHNSQNSFKHNSLKPFPGGYISDKYAALLTSTKVLNQSTNDKQLSNSLNQSYKKGVKTASFNRMREPIKNAYMPLNYTHQNGKGNDYLQISKPYQEFFDETRPKTSEKNGFFLGYQSNQPERQLKQEITGISVDNNLATGTNQVVSIPNSASMYQNSQVQQQIHDLSAHFSTGNKDDVQQLKTILCNLIQKEEEVIELILSRCDKVKELADIIYYGDPTSSDQAENSQNASFNATGSSVYQALRGQPANELAKLRKTLNSLSQSLVNASQNEITLGSKLRETVKLGLDISQLKKQNIHYKDKNNEQQKVIDLLQVRIKTFQEENNKLLIQLNSEKKSSQANSKKVEHLGKRVEFILENDINVNLNPNDKLRQSLNELLRENESLKRDLTHKNQEIERLQGNIKRLNLYIQRLNKKFETFKKNPNLLQSTAGNTALPSPDLQEQDSSIFKKDDIDLLSNFKIPQNLNFRVVSLKTDQQNMITDIIELGSGPFTKQILQIENPQEKRNMIDFVVSQFISYKDICERTNWMLYELSQIQKLPTIKDIVLHVNSNFSSVFNATRCNLWVVDKQCGVFQTFQGSTVQKCFLNKGLISDSFLFKLPINSKTSSRPLLFKLDSGGKRDDGEYVDQTLLLPIFVDKERQQVKGILEVSNSKNDLFSFDEEYYGIIVSHFLSDIFYNILKREIFEVEQKYNDLLFKAYESLVQSKNKYNFTLKVKQWTKDLFNINNSIFYFVENKELVLYSPDNQRNTFSLGHGLAGLAVTDKKSYIINDTKASTVFNILVDIQSILPIFAVPLFDQNPSNEEDVISYGVLEFVLRSNYQSKKERDSLMNSQGGSFGFEDPVTNVLNKYSSLVMHALKNMRFEN